MMRRRSSAKRRGTVIESTAPSSSMRCGNPVTPHASSCARLAAAGVADLAQVDALFPKVKEHIVTTRVVHRLGGGLAIAFSLLTLAACNTTKAATPPAPPAEVGVTTVVERSVPVSSE